MQLRLPIARSVPGLVSDYDLHRAPPVASFRSTLPILPTATGARLLPNFPEPIGPPAHAPLALLEAQQRYGSEHPVPVLDLVLNPLPTTAFSGMVAGDTSPLPLSAASLSTGGLSAGALRRESWKTPIPALVSSNHPWLAVSASVSRGSPRPLESGATTGGRTAYSGTLHVTILNRTAQLGIEFVVVLAPPGPHWGRPAGPGGDDGDGGGVGNRGSGPHPHDSVTARQHGVTGMVQDALDAAGPGSADWKLSVARAVVSGQCPPSYRPLWTRSAELAGTIHDRGSQVQWCGTTRFHHPLLGPNQAHSFERSFVTWTPHPISVLPRVWLWTREWTIAAPKPPKTPDTSGRHRPTITDWIPIRPIFATFRPVIDLANYIIPCI